MLRNVSFRPRISLWAKWNSPGLKANANCFYESQRFLSTSTCHYHHSVTWLVTRQFANDSRSSYPGCQPGTRVVPSYPQSTPKTKTKVVCTPSKSGSGTSGTGGGTCPPPGEDPKKRKRDERLMIAMVVGATAFALAYFLGLFDKSAKKAKEKLSKKSKTGRQFARPKAIPRNPEDPNELPIEVPYLLIGGGTASFSAFRAIKSNDPKAKVLVISNEGNYPYMRPPLSKEMWFNQKMETTEQLRFKQWNGVERSLFYEPADFYSPCSELMSRENGGVAVALGYSVDRIDVFEKKAYLDTGTSIRYDKCLIATGSVPRNLPLFKTAPAGVQEKITLFRDIFDFQEIDEVLRLGAKHVVIVGSGFLGSELACALARKGRDQNLQVYQIFREPGNMGKVLPEYLSNWTTKKVREEGVNVITNTIIQSVRREGNYLLLTCSNGDIIKADHVVVAVGANANTDLAMKSELEIDEDFGGYLVNAELMARSNLWVAGDCTCFYDVKLGRRRVEHHDHAVISGRLAGENMTGAGKPYWHQSMFWSDLGPDVGYEAIGIVDSHLPTVGVFAKASSNDSSKGTADDDDDDDDDNDQTSDSKDKAKEKTIKQDPGDKATGSLLYQPSHDEDYSKGVVFYLVEGHVVGIVLWNVFNRMSIAREVLKQETKYDDLNEVAKLFSIHKRDEDEDEPAAVEQEKN